MCPTLFLCVDVHLRGIPQCTAPPLCLPSTHIRYLCASKHIAVETDPVLWEVEASLQEDVPLESAGIVYQETQSR